MAEGEYVYFPPAPFAALATVILQAGEKMPVALELFPARMYNVQNLEFGDHRQRLPSRGLARPCSLRGLVRVALAPHLRTVYTTYGFQTKHSSIKKERFS